MKNEREQLEAQATEEQKWSAHTNAVDTTKQIDGDAYDEAYISTLKMLLDS